MKILCSICWGFLHQYSKEYWSLDFFSYKTCLLLALGNACLIKCVVTCSFLILGGICFRKLVLFLKKFVICWFTILFSILIHFLNLINFVSNLPTFISDFINCVFSFFCNLAKVCQFCWSKDQLLGCLYFLILYFVYLHVISIISFRG